MRRRPLPLVVVALLGALAIPAAARHGTAAHVAAHRPPARPSAQSKTPQPAKPAATTAAVQPTTQPAPPPAPRVQGPTPALDASEAKPILARLMAAKTAAERRTAVAQLAALEPKPFAALAEFLARVRRSTDVERRAVLATVGADLPDELGKFHAPERQTADDEKKNDAFDWLAKLVEINPAVPGVADVVADVASIRALADTHDPAGAAAIIEFAFEPDGVTYRDECGRFLRRMAPWSLPALIRAAQKEGEGSRSRYANYQLERLDCQNPRKALADAPNDQLKAAILDAFKDSLYREAVFVVLDTIDDGSPLVRKAARAAWTEYVAGRMPPDAPKEHLALPGGKLAEETPLYLTSRELADIVLHKRVEEITRSKPDPKATLSALSEQLFAFYDGRRAAALGLELDAALALARAGKTVEAAAACDRILVQVPDLARRAEAAPVYVALGDSLGKDGKWRQAAVAFGKAADAAGATSEIGVAALAKHHQARGKAAEESGKSGAVEFARAKEITADRPRREGGSERVWMLYVGLSTLLAGVALMLVGWALRRQ